MPSNITTSTASKAGLELRWSKWTTARERTTRLEVLVKYYSSLGMMGMASCQDEEIAMKIIKRHLSGPSGSVEVSRRLSETKEGEICWIEPEIVRSVNDSIVKKLRKGLKES